MGWSLVASRPVWEAFWTYFPVTLEMNLFAAPIVLFFGIWLGTVSGIHRDKWIDHTTRILAIVGWSLPTFLFALVLLMIFYGYFQIFSPGVISDQLNMFILDNPDKFTRYTGMYTIDGILNGRWEVTLNALAHLVLPVIDLRDCRCGFEHAGHAFGDDRRAFKGICDYRQGQGG